MNIWWNKASQLYGGFKLGGSCLVLLVALFIQTFLGGSLKAQTLNFKHFTTDDGLPENTGQALLQDRQGFIWIGTQNGLVRYNAYEFKTFKNQSNDSTTLSNNQVQDLFEDSRGFIWVATRNGLNRFNSNTESFERYFPNPKQVFETNWLQFGINEDANGSIWFCNFNGVYQIVNWDKKEFRFYPATHSTDEEHLVMHRDDEDNLWVGQGTNLYQFQNDELKLEHQLQGNIGAISNNGHQLTVATNLGLFDVSKRQVKPLYSANDWNGGIPLFAKYDIDNNLWLGTTNGAYSYKSGRLREKYSHQADDEGSLSHNTALSWLQDSQGLIWIGTGQGINLADPMHRQVQRFNSKSSTPILLPDDNVEAIAFDHNNQLWVGGPKGLLRAQFSESPNGNKALNDILVESELLLPNENIDCIYPSENGVIWVGTVTGKLLLWDEETQLFQEFYNGEGLQQLRNIVRSHDGEKLLLGCGNGLFLFDIESRRLQQPNWLEHIDYVVHMGMFGHELWIGSNDAIYVLNISEKTSRKYRVGDANSNGLTNTMITHLWPTDSVLWFTTFGGGFHVFDPDKESFSSITDANGLPNNNVWCVYPDQKSNLWMSTDNGVCRYNPVSQETLQLHRGDGFSFDDYSMKAHCQFPNGTLALGNPKGLNIFSPDVWETNPFPPPVAITEIDVNYQSRKFDFGQSELMLYPDDRSVTLYYCGLNYRNPQKNQYRVRLTGYDENWIERSSDQLSATYTDLPAGDYQFEVLAANDAGVWNNEKALLPIKVLPPFYETTWFRVLASLLLIGLITLVVYWYNRRKYLRTIQKLQTAERIQNERQRISRDLHDHVGAHLTKVISDLDLLSLKMDLQTKDESLASIDNTRQFTQSTVRLLRDTIWAINKDHYAVEEFANKAEAFLKQFLSENMNWKVSRAIDVNRNLSPNEVLNLLRILQEASQNMLKYAKASLFKVDVTSNSEGVTMLIEDNGIGIQTSNKEREHYGLLNMEKRAADIGARFSIESAVDEGVIITILL